jgi:tetratricopeptide (TPR) repeat protein
MGDRHGEARMIAREGQALGTLRRRDEALARLDHAWVEFADLGDDDPNRIGIGRQIAGIALQTGDYKRATEMADLVLGLAERQGLPDMAAHALLTLGTAAFYTGRQWQARSLVEGARKLSEEEGSKETLFRALVMLPSITALDDPREALATERNAIALARRSGNRASENGLIYNAVEDARRTGEWEWAVSELAAIAQLDIDESSLAGNRAQQVFFEVYQGRFDETELPDLRRRTEVLEDRDLQSGLVEIDGAIAYVAGDWAAAAKAWMAVADVSDLNAPYSLPRAGRVGILAGDAVTAQAAVDRLAALGSKGRAMDADRAAIRAGLAALAGDRAAARAGYRLALTAFRDLGLPWDEALAGMEAAQWLGDGDAELAAWAETSRAVFTRIGAIPLIARLDEAIAHGNAAVATGDGAPPQAAANAADTADASLSVREG